MIGATNAAARANAMAEKTAFTRKAADTDDLRRPVEARNMRGLR
jgi:hypothetical protein